MTAPTGANHDTNARTGLGELAWLFLRLGATSFGGPAAHTAMMEDEVVRRRAWMTRAHFLDLLGATNLIPGPNSTELAIHIGRDRRGWQGLLVAGSCFVAPAALIVGAFAWAYVRYGTLPEVTGVLYGIKPVIIAVVLQALWGLGRTAIKTAALGALAAAALAASLYGVHELGVLGAAGGLVAIGRGLWRPGPATGWLPLPLFGASSTVAAGAVSLPSLFGVFVKIGAVLFGSGYVLLAFLRADLVERLHWLTEAQLLDAIAVGQVTPGPVFTTATFVGYLLAGASGAAVATVGIFLPAFVFVALSAPFIPRLRASKLAGAVLDGVNVASLALMAAVTIELGRTTVVDLPTIAIAAVVTLLLVRYRVSSMWLVLAGGVFGAIWQLV